MLGAPAGTYAGSAEMETEAAEYANAPADVVEFRPDEY